MTFSKGMNLEMMSGFEVDVSLKFLSKTVWSTIERRVTHKYYEGLSEKLGLSP